jgi:iron complex outermembrane recepter protein
MWGVDRQASLGRRGSRWLESTVIVTLLISSCGNADAQDQSTPGQTTPAQPNPAPVPGEAPAPPNLPPVTVTEPVKRRATPRPAQEGSASRRVTRQPNRVTQQPRQRVPTATPTAATTQEVVPGSPSPNLAAIPSSATRLGLSVRETPASVDIVTQQTIQDQGYRTNVDAAQGAVGVLAVDSAGAPGGFSMRGFEFDQINHLYNGINIGAQDLTGRNMDAFMFDRIEFLKGASAIESGQGAIGGSVNYVTKQPTTGPVQNEAYVAVDSLGSVRSGYGSGGSTPIAGLDYRFDMAFSHINSFIEDDNRNMSSLTTRLNYKNSEVFKTWIAFEYYKDAGHVYWGTPLVPTSFSGPYATSGVVSGSEFSHFNGSFLGPVTIDSRTLTTNYNTLDNFDGATQYWGRGGFEWEIAPNITVKDQAYVYRAKRTFFDAEYYAFDSTVNAVDRLPFFVSHDQHLVGDILNLTWNSSIFGMQNRFAAELAASRNKIVFTESFNSSSDTVSLIAPDRGYFGPLVTQTRVSQLDTISESFEDRLKITPTVSLIGGVRIDELNAFRNGFDPTGAIEPGFPFSQSWQPVSYRAAATWEPISKLVFYGLYGTAFDPAAAAIFELQPTQPLLLTSSRIYEAGVKQTLWDNRAEWTFAVYDLDRRNVYEQISAMPITYGIAGEIDTKGIEAGGAIRPIEGLKLWGNIAFTQARFATDVISGVTFTGNTPPNVAPIIANVGLSYRFEKQLWYRWLPIELGATMRHVGDRYIFDDNEITMDSYTVYDAFLFIDFDKPSLLPTIEKTRLSFRVKNITDKVYAAWADPGYQDQIYLGAPRTYEVAMSFKW